MERRITSFNEFLNLVFELEDNDPDNGENKQQFLYRGQSDCEWELLPSLARRNVAGQTRSVFSQEQQIIEIAKRRLPQIFEQNLDPIDLLALMQHYGLPTRLLDVTTNPLVALYFSCVNHERDGEVIVFKHDAEEVTDYSFANAIAESYKLIHIKTNDLQVFYQNIEKKDYFHERSIRVKRMFKVGNEYLWLQQMCKGNLTFVHAQEKLDRQRIQQGQFVIFPNRIICSKKPYFEFEIDPIDKSSRFIKCRIIIAKEAKMQIRDRLRIVGICEGTLFPDSVDAICRQITNDASKRISYPHAVG